MSFLDRLKGSLSGIGQSFVRYPLASLLFIFITILNAIMIEDSYNSYPRLLFTALTGALLSVVAQHLYERFFKKEQHRWLLMGASLLFTVIYYFILPNENNFDLVYSVRSLVLMFALFIAFIWVPAIRNHRLYFHQNFLTVFKAAIVTLLFSGVLSIGISAILSSMNLLLFEVDFNTFFHAANIVWCFFAPIYFFSLIPHYRGEEVLEGEWQEAFSVPRFLAILLLYIIIPLLVVYTVILLIYLVMNIGGEFWNDNLLEPLLVSYAIIVIIVYLLTCNLEHKFSELFRKVFPKIMLPIVLLQTVASILKIQELGITHGRYYVILFGLFATAAGVIFSFFPRERNGWIAPILLVLALISVTPPVDAFSVARANQESRMTTALEENGMLANGEITPDANISNQSKITISRSVDYLARVERLDEVAYLPENFNPYFNFEQVFGFAMTFAPNDGPSQMGRYAYLDWSQTPVLSLEEADYMFYLFLTNNDANRSVEVGNGMTLYMEQGEPYFVFRLENESGEEIMQADTAELFTQAFESGGEKSLLTAEDLTLVLENEQVKMTLLGVRLDEFNNQLTAEIMLFLDVK